MSVSRNVFAMECEVKNKRVKKPKVRTLLPHDLTKLERKMDKKKQYAESALWKHRRNKEIQRFRERKYAEPLDDPLDFSAETFSNELSSREAHHFYVEHTFLKRSTIGSAIRMKGTIYCTPKSSLKVGYGRANLSQDDIAVIQSVDVNGRLTPVREVCWGNWYDIENAIMRLHEYEYGHGEYNMMVK